MASPKISICFWYLDTKVVDDILVILKEGNIDVDANLCEKSGVLKNILIDNLPDLGHPRGEKRRDYDTALIVLILIDDVIAERSDDQDIIDCGRTVGDEMVLASLPLFVGTSRENAAGGAAGVYDLRPAPGEIGGGLSCHGRAAVRNRHGMPRRHRVGPRPNKTVCPQIITIDALRNRPRRVLIDAVRRIACTQDVDIRLRVTHKQ